MRQYAASGVTTAQNAYADRRLIRHFAEAARRSRLSLRLVVLPEWETALAIARGDFSPDVPDHGHLRLGPAKVFADGSIQGYTDYLAKPYHVPFGGDETYRGYPIFARERLAAILRELHQAGLQIAVHGNGDAAIDDIIEALRAAQAAHPRLDARHVLVHAQMTRDDQLDAMKELGITPSFFSLHTYYWGDRHRDIFIGPERTARISPAQGAADRGLRFSIYCDTPVVPMTPLLLVWSAVQRISTSGAVIGAEQRITPAEALAAVTIDAAWQYFGEDDVGSLEPGKLADLVHPIGIPAPIRSRFQFPRQACGEPWRQWRRVSSGKMRRRCLRIGKRRRRPEGAGNATLRAALRAHRRRCPALVMLRHHGAPGAWPDERARPSYGVRNSDGVH